jgi:ATP-binding cassette subfamily C protein
MHETTTTIVPSVAYRLRVVASYDSWRAGQEFIVEGALTIGRDPQCDIVLADAAVSRQHAWITVAPGGLELRDLNSGNGVWVDGAQVATVLLRHGQRFQIGSTQFECVAVPRVEAVGQKPTAAAEPIADGFEVRCVVVGLPGEGRAFTIDGPAATVGRTADCDIRLEEADISRRHARIERVAGGFLITDLGSASGTWIGSQPISEVVIGPGERFRIGTHVELFCQAEVDASRALALDEGATRVITPDEGATRVITPDEDATRVITPDEDATRVIPPDDDATRVFVPDEDATRVIVPDDDATRVIAPDDDATRVILADRSESGTPVRRATVEPASSALAPAAAVEEDLDFSATVVIPLSAALAASARGLEEQGEEVTLSAQKPFLLDDPSYAWYVVSGGLFLYAVALESAHPVGPRTHLVGILPGQCAFGFDVRRYGMASGILAVAKPGTVVRKISATRLRELGDVPAQREAVAGLVDAWVGGLAKALIRDVAARRPDVTLEAGQAVTIPSGARASTADGVVWIDLWSGSALVDDMATLSFARKRVLFPITPHLWIRPVGDEFGSLEATPATTAGALGRPELWDGLEVLCRIFCECEFINKKLAAADEFERLEQKERFSELAEKNARDAIGSVLTSEGEQRPFEFDRMTGEPVVQACRIVAAALGIDVRAPVVADEELAYEDHVSAISSASGFRTRLVALRDDWWRKDQGPLLAQMADTRNPVALLPRGPGAYELVDPDTDERRPITEALAGTLSGFAYVFYRPLPSGEVSPAELVRFGARGCGRDFRTVALMAVILGAFGTVTPFLTGRLFDQVIPESDRALLAGFTVALFLSALAGALFKLTQGIATVRVQTRMESSIQAAVWDRLLDLPVTFFRRYAAGDLADRANGVDQIQQLVAGAGVAAILGSISGLFFVVQMFSYNLRLALLALLLTAIFVSATTLANYLQLRYQRVEIGVRGRIAGLVLNLIGGVSKLRVCGAERHAFRVWALQFAEQKRLAFQVGKVQSASMTFSAVFPILSSMAIFSVMIWEQAEAAKNGEPGLTVGQFIAFTSAYGLFLAAMQALGDASLNLLRIVPIYERLAPILRTAPEVDRSKAFGGRLRGHISISRLHFRYQPEAPFVVKDLSLEIKPGEFVAFVGSSGCGKSTLMRLMLGFEQPASGAIAYDGQDLSTLDLRALRQQIGVVLQVSRVMPTELYRNIIGTSARTIEDAWEAAERAGLAEDVKQMPMQMHTYVSEGGGTLSGGQRQRLMIARAIVNKPKILFLDEATSALDNRTQAIVTESLDRMEATRIVIAHRLSTIVHADRICYMEAGTIVEMGTYDELMALNGRFAELARRQIA